MSGLGFLIVLVVLLAGLLFAIGAKAVGRNQPDPTDEDQLPIRHRARKHRAPVTGGTAEGKVLP